MSKLDWKKAKKPTATRALADEKEWAGKDDAARWLARNEAMKPAKKKKATRHNLRREDVRQGPVDGRPGVVIYTDGACEPNPGKGGWGFVVYTDGGETHSECGGSLASTNNIMEMTAVKMAVLWAIENGLAAKIVSDSQYVVKGCNEWRFGWKARGWKRKASGGKLEPVKNAELWAEIDEVLRRAKVTLEWCKGHAGILGNERADELSNIGRQQVDGVTAAIRQQLSYSV